MKTIPIGLLLGVLSQPVFSQDMNASMDFETAQDDLVTAKYNLATDKFNQVLEELRTHEMFAGRVSEISFRGQNYVIDRSNEAVVYKPGLTKPSKPSLLGTLLDDLSTRTSGQIHIKVTQEVFNKDGVIQSRDIWEIDAGGMWEAQTGMGDAAGKSHK